jgi:hypothetical protein
MKRRASTVDVSILSMMYKRMIAECLIQASIPPIPFERLVMDTEIGVSAFWHVDLREDRPPTVSHGLE